MVDVHSPIIRSYNMSQVKSKDTRPELLVRQWLWSNGFRYRLQVSVLSGKPDIVLKKYNAVIFVNGCFWHQHENCKYSSLPQKNKHFWREKLHKNKERDLENVGKLIDDGWRVAILWQCSLKNENLRIKSLEKLCKWIKSKEVNLSIP